MSQFNGVGEQPAILVEGLTKSFGDVHALRGIDLSVPRGTVFGVLGPNGAGKTTAVRILTTLLLPDGGRAIVEGHDVVREASAVRRTIGLAGQSAAIQEELTGRENLEIIGRLYHLSWPRARSRAARVAGTVRPGRCCRPGRQELLRWHAAPPGPGRQPGRQAPGPVPGRADDGPGPAVAAGDVGDHPVSWSPGARRCCSPPSTWTRPTSWPTRSWSSTTAWSSPRARPRS